MQKRKLSGDVEMGGVPSEMADHPTKNLDNDLFGDGRNLVVANATVFISSPAMKPSLSLNTMKRPFEDSTDIWSRIDGALEWDMRSPEHVELEELDGMFDDL
jgi:hypothetical protein